MSFYGERIVPRVIDKVLGTKGVDRLRRELVTDLSGVVLEIGFGSGLNLPFLPAGVTKVLAVDPSTVARRLAEPRIRARGVPVETIGLDGARLDLPDASVDHVLSTMTLCTIPDVESALREVRRVLRPGGTFVFLEHGLSPDPRIGRRQRRFTPIQKRLAAGCHLDRDIAALVTRAGFTIEGLNARYERGPKAFSWFTSGVARPSEGRLEPVDGLVGPT